MYKFEICDFSNPKHVDAYVGLLNEYMADPMGDHEAHTSEKQAQLIASLKNHHGAFVVLASYDGDYVGFVTCFTLLSTFYIKPYTYIHDFFVSGRCRGKGIGRLMMDYVVADAREKDCCKVALEVRVDNPVAQNLYKSSGFGAVDPDMLFWVKPLK